MATNIGKIRYPKNKTKRVWLSCYFNHYNAIVIFHKKPTLTKAGEGWEKMDYDYYDLIDPKNRKTISGVLFMEDFKSLFPTVNISSLIQKNGNVISCEPTVLVEAKITAPFDKDGKLISIDYTLDGYNDQH